MHLTEWTFVPWALRDHLAELCLPEKWYYGDQPEPGKELSILNNYLDNTFRRLCYEGKVVIRVDPANGRSMLHLWHIQTAVWLHGPTAIGCGRMISTILRRIWRRYKSCKSRARFGLPLSGAFCSEYRISQP